MLYIHYDRITIPTPQDPAGALGYVRFVFTASASNLKSRTFSREDMTQVKELVIYIKQIPAAQRVYDPTHKIWTVKSLSFKPLRAVFTASVSYFDDRNFIQHIDLVQDIDSAASSHYKVGWDNFTEREEKIEEEDFFYSAAQPMQQGKCSIQSIEASLLKLFELPQMPSTTLEQTRCYRRTALKLHPDRNNGDGSKMSELNMLWQQYKDLVKM